MAAKQVVCDTDVMIDYLDRLNARHEETKIVLEDVIGLDNVCISAITNMELLQGAVNKTDLAKINKNINRFNVVLIDHHITYKAISLVQAYSLSHKLGLPDGLIAATAITVDIDLFTYNKRDYKFIPELKLFKH